MSERPDLPEIPPTPSWIRPLEKLVEKIPPKAPVIVAGGISILDLKLLANAITEHSVTGTVATTSSLLLFGTLIYINHARTASETAYHRLQEEVLENPYRDFVQNASQEVIHDLEATHALSQTLHLTGKKQELFDTYLAAHLLNRDHIANLLPHNFLDQRERAMDEIAFAGEVVGNPFYTFLYRELPQMHGLAELSLLGKATDIQETMPQEDREQGAWTLENIAYAAQAIADCLSPESIPLLLRKFAPVALEAASTLEPRGFAQRRLRKNYTTWLTQITEQVTQPENQATKDARQARIDSTISRIFYRLGGPN